VKRLYPGRRPRVPTRRERIRGGRPVDREGLLRDPLAPGERHLPDPRGVRLEHRRFFHQPPVQSGELRPAGQEVDPPAARGDAPAPRLPRASGVGPFPLRLRRLREKYVLQVRREGGGRGPSGGLQEAGSRVVIFSLFVRRTAHKLDLRTGVWTRVANLLMARCYVSAAALDGKVYALGGFDGVARTRTAERFDPEGNRWEVLPSMRVVRWVFLIPPRVAKRPSNVSLASPGRTPARSPSARRSWSSGGSRGPRSTVPRRFLTQTTTPGRRAPPSPRRGRAARPWCWTTRPT
jgi:hypothetical protein